MVYLTGDTHGELDRFKHGRLRWLGKRDIVVVLGDFGFVWDGSKEEQKKLDWLQLLTIVDFTSIWRPVAAIFAAAGILIGVGGSLTAIRKFLHV